MAAGCLALLAKCKYTAIDVRLSAAHARRGAFHRLQCARLHEKRRRPPAGTALLASQRSVLFVPFFYRGNKFNSVPLTKV